jgi:hypothetical protein
MRSGSRKGHCATRASVSGQHGYDRQLMAKPGDRVRLISTSDPHVELEEGTEGTVEFVDSMGTVHVRFEDGTTLGLVADEDAFELVSPEAGDD